MSNSILDAIRAGDWDFEPNELNREGFEATPALPGSHEKLAVLTQRVARGLPLWHPADRLTCDGSRSD